jgi:catechol 2,3-dioxygenase-like lactoylglutathione lyase family enzyme
MKIHHAMFVVSDMAPAVRLWRDLLGFQVIVDDYLPEGAGGAISQKLLDDITHVKGAHWKTCLLTHPRSGANIELQQPLVPKPQKTPRGYEPTGVRELALMVDGIDAWFEKVRGAGYETQTDYIWGVGTIRTFLFFDEDGNQIQLWESLKLGDTGWGI